MPYRHVLPAMNRAHGDPYSFITEDGTIEFVFDLENFDFHIDATFGYSPSRMNAVLQQAEWWGLELMPYSECDVDFLPGGITRIYLTPIVPVEVAEAEMVRELLAEVDALTVTPLDDSLEEVPSDPELHGDPEQGAPEQLGAA
ncbi:hypothetical protein SEA_VERSE_31 [Streptomyces phage Verse]|uniref:Uncharacterized protein n=2 Tax=Streptomyces phage Amela TaxID=1673877 RepID=A0A0K1Y9K7_9CAUD|nr:hypothetical protein AVT29_gp31 [Streptomyces phage Amela]AKY03786.1 hypothetical protein SEA_AMELA_31 [Streptomyces phage Amela]AKY03861.1 hypothetical protein SEA_VERSE_31 [Streptomyces phage Verse]